uniref:GLOBIN domain-containing protein n=1 Tax=Steinernema glaseri TaxID=37863 RepID=A0A1I8AP87_9BILA
MGNSHPRASPLHFKKKKLRELRRQSVPSGTTQSLGTDTHVNHISFTFGGEEPIKPTSSTTPPRIQINGRDSTEEEDLEYNFAPHINEENIKTIRDQIIAEKRNRPAAVRRMEFLTSCGSLTVRSLDDGQMPDVEFEMKPLNRARSLSPLKQMRTYSYKSVASEENVLDEEQRLVLKTSWKNIKERLERHGGKTFGYYVFERIFTRVPHLKPIFKIDMNIKGLDQLPEEHSFLRHTSLFTNIIDLAVRNVDQLEAQMAPAMFTYGQRHYNSKMMQGAFTEENVRLFCGQVVCSVVDVLNEEIEPICMEAWIEIMRYLGRTLLNGFEYERLAATKKISINTNDHVFFML